jgi:hypothetical protein
MAVIKEEVARELLYDMYWVQKLSTCEIADRLRVSQSALYRRMQRLGVPTRSRKDALTLVSKINRIAKKLLEELYCERKMSTIEIAKKLNISTSTIHRALVKYGIPRRTSLGTRTRYSKTPFTANLIEAAYFLGLRAGDFHARKHRKQVMITTGSAHPATLDLMHNTFGNYGRIGRYPIYNSRTQKYNWFIWAILDSSFGFLIPKPQMIPNDILNDDEQFLAFLAGYVDSEGRIGVYRKKDAIALTFRIASEDEKILRGAYNKLKELGYHPILYVEIEREKATRHYKCNKDFWCLEICYKKDILKLLKSLPIRHSEKVRKRELILQVANLTRWNDVKDQVLKLRKEIREEVLRCIREAEEEYKRRHLNFMREL